MSDEIDDRFRRTVFSTLPMTKTCTICERLSDVVVHAFCEEGHCERRECVAKCQSCQDWFEAIAPESGGSVLADAKEEPGQDSRPRPLPVELTIEESDNAIQHAVKVRRSHASGYGTKAFDGEDELLSNEIFGAKGEVVVRKAFRLPTKLTLLRGGDGGRGDVLLPSGKMIGVKSTNRWMQNPRLSHVIPQTLLDDYGVLVSPDGKGDETPKGCLTFEIVGWISREEYQKKKHPWKGKFAPSEGVFAKELRNIRELIALEGKKSKKEDDNGRPTKKSRHQNR